jgi:phosphoglycolate phosphatase
MTDGSDHPLRLTPPHLAPTLPEGYLRLFLENLMPVSSARLKAVVFDFDGTLADSFPAITASVNHVRGLHGLAPLSVPEVKRFVGRGAPYLLSHTVGVGDLESNVAAYKEHHPSVLQSGTKLKPGAAETLQTLHRRGLKLAVCSNKPVAFTRTLMALLNVASTFDAALGPEDVARPKPAPDMLQAALALLGVSPKEALYVGDMGVDVETARSAGVAVWVVPTGTEDLTTLQAARPDRVARDLHQVAEWVAAMT